MYYKLEDIRLKMECTSMAIHLRFVKLEISYFCWPWILFISSDCDLRNWKKIKENVISNIFLFWRKFGSVTVVWSVEFLPSNLVRPGFESRRGQGFFVSILELDVCPLSVFYLVLSLTVTLTFCWLRDSGRHTLVYLFTVLIHRTLFPYRHLDC